METDTWGPDQHTSRGPSSRHTSVARWLANGLIIAGMLFLLGAAAYAAYSLLTGWLMEQERYVLNRDIASLSIMDGSMPPANPAVEPSGGPSLQPSADSFAVQPSPPVQIRIPALRVKRSIIEVPLARNPHTGVWTRDLSTLLRSQRRDMVGHWGGSAYPGQAGNTILVGHNYGYGYQAVFVRLGRLKAGQEVQVVTGEGETFAYKVKTVDRVRWRRKDLEEAQRHSSFLAPGGAERLTLVTCGGAGMGPFPERIYVVAEPVH